MPGYSIELDLKGKAVLVVGMGAVGTRKAEGLIEAGARVIGVDPEGTRKGPEGVERRVEVYKREHMKGMALVFAAATEDVNKIIVKDAKQAGIWVNSASDPSEGDVRVPAVWREGGLTLTVATAGASPALARALRDRAAEALGAVAAGLTASLAKLRPEVLAALADDAVARRRVLADWADPRWLEVYATGGPEAVREEVLRAIERESTRK